MQPELTHRQHQILQLLQAGKVNKEVANELGIGVGTVKQHIVAIFKKLKVRNRAMAVSRGIDLGQVSERPAAVQIPGVSLTCRPCVVLGMALPSTADVASVRLLYGTLAELSATHDAIFLARQDNACEVIFGVQRVTEYDVALALQTAFSVYQSLKVTDSVLAEQVRGCLTAGLAFASMRRFGGWTGEAIASAAIATARELLQNTAPGLLTSDAKVQELIETFGMSGAQDLPAGTPFSALDTLRWTGVRREYPLVGRISELAQLCEALAAAVEGKGALMAVQGEMGMGKSRLCQALFEYSAQQHIGGCYFRSLPPMLGVALFDLGHNLMCTLDQALTALRSPDIAASRLVILDDFHLIAAEQQHLFLLAAAEAVVPGRLIVLSGRKTPAKIARISVQTIRMRRLPAKDMRALVQHALGDDASNRTLVQSILGSATGVPLFGVELARRRDETSLTLPVLVAVHARLDNLQLDSDLLRLVAKSEIAPGESEITCALKDEPVVIRQHIDRAMATGVLTRQADGGLSFSHPMIHRVIENSVME